MTEEVKTETQPIPKNMDWTVVAKASGDISEGVLNKAAPQEMSITDRIVKAVKPYLMDWKIIQASSEAQESTIKTPKTEPAKPFDFKAYMGKLSSTESGDNPTAKAKTSTATGLHQFTSGTWMDMVNKLDLPYTLSDRTNPEKSMKVAEEFTKRNVAKAKADLGREPTMLEAYMYHFVGKSAPKLIQAPYKALAVDYVTPTQAKANKNVFYDKAGEPKTVGEVMAKYEERFK
jgi:muramidase (phage lysozyme)